MLEFIVLGIFPGTSFVVTLWWVFAITLLLSVAVFLRFEIKHVRNNQKHHGKLFTSIFRK